MGEGAALDSGDLAGVVLTRASPIDIPTIIWRALSGRARLSRHRRVHGFSGIDGLTVRSLDGRPLPLQVDGDYIGTAPEAHFRLEPRGHLARRLKPREARTSRSSPDAERTDRAAGRHRGSLGAPVGELAGGGGSPVLAGTRCPVLPGRQPVEPARRPAPGGRGLGRADRARSASTARCTRTSAPGSTTAARSGSRIAIVSPPHAAGAGELRLRLGVRRPPLSAAAERPDRGRRAPRPGTGT